MPLSEVMKCSVWRLRVTATRQRVWVARWGSMFQVWLNSEHVNLSNETRDSEYDVTLMWQTYMIQNKSFWCVSRVLRTYDLSLVEHNKTSVSRFWAVFRQVLGSFLERSDFVGQFLSARFFVAVFLFWAVFCKSSELSELNGCSPARRGFSDTTTAFCVIFCGYVSLLRFISPK